MCEVQGQADHVQGQNITRLILKCLAQSLNN